MAGFFGSLIAAEVSPMAERKFLVARYQQARGWGWSWASPKAVSNPQLYTLSFEEIWRYYWDY